MRKRKKKMTIDFKMEKGENRGLYHTETERVLIYPLQHENITDLVNKITHELLHLAIDHTDETLDDDQEEAGIFYLQWADEFIV